MALAISVANLGKRYTIRHEGGSTYRSLREEVSNRFAGIGRRLVVGGQANPTPKREFFWALRDVNLKIEQGERLGIIGRNGAGKSTLLKLLSRITEPTSGRIHTRGRIGSLLEVGTGFHPEMTGRENIFLNGAILGMRRAEIRKKFDEIVAFADIENFLDTPVKRYSSGMYVRLAFSVAAHLEPEILIVDEVLAVGDIEFQKKCLGKMEEVSEGEGRTVLFVSHNMAAISSLCGRCVLLSHGGVVADGRTSDVILRYHSGNDSASSSFFDYAAIGRAVGDEDVRLLSGSVEDASGRRVNEVTIHERLKIRMRYRIEHLSPARIVPNFHFFASDGAYAFVDNAPDIGVMKPGDYEAVCEIGPHLLNEGTYTVGLAVTSYLQGGFTVNFYERDALRVNVRDPMDPDSNRYGYTGGIPGVVRPRLKWEIQQVGR